MKLRQIVEHEQIFATMPLCNYHILDMGIKLITEATAGFDDVLPGDSQQLSQALENPNTNQKKNIIRNYWDKHKNKIKLAAIGTAGIIALIISGIPLGSLIPFFGMQAVIKSANRAIQQMSGNAKNQLRAQMIDTSMRQPQQNPEFAERVGNMPAGAIFAAPGGNFYLKRHSEDTIMHRVSLEEIDAYASKIYGDGGFIKLFVDPQSKMLEIEALERVIGHHSHHDDVPTIYDLFSSDNLRHSWEQQPGHYEPDSEGHNRWVPDHKYPDHFDGSDKGKGLEYEDMYLDF